MGKFLLAFGLAIGGAAWLGYGDTASVPLHDARQTPDDLEVTGLPGHATAYVSRAEMARLPQVKATVADDPDYAGVTMHVTGVYLDVLAKALGAPKEDDLIDALCTDKYRSHYPADYIAAHHPIFVLTVDDMLPAAWAAKTHQDDPGPYYIVYEHYVPGFKVLSHADQPALPTNVFRLNFSTAAATFGAISPGAQYRENEAVQQGFTIARQNCLRCHFSGVVGGKKSGRSWQELSNIARSRPEYFSSYIGDPKSQDPHSQMPGNPQYDAATRAALTSYFATFTEPGK